MLLIIKLKLYCEISMERAEKNEAVIFEEGKFTLKQQERPKIEKD